MFLTVTLFAPNVMNEIGDRIFGSSVWIQEEKNVNSFHAVNHRLTAHTHLTHEGDEWKKGRGLSSSRFLSHQTSHRLSGEAWIKTLVNKVRGGRESWAVHGDLPWLVNGLLGQSWDYEEWRTRLLRSLTGRKSCLDNYGTVRSGRRGCCALPIDD